MAPPEMIFLLASPRTGSTLMRVMLAGHTDLFSPPELSLLPFSNMAEWSCRLGAAARCLGDCDQRTGLVEAVMHLTGSGVEHSEAWVGSWVARNTPTEHMFSVVRSLAAPRRLVDKSTLNASSIDALARSLWISPGAHYIHLVRHPLASVESLQRTYLQHLPPTQALQVAETLWSVPNRNILWLLRRLDPERHTRIHFETLVRDPERVMRGLCEFLGLDFQQALLEPYSGNRMTSGSPGRFRSVGDPNFDAHTHIEPDLADAWQTVTLPATLSDATRELAMELGYPAAQLSHRPGPREPVARGPGVILAVPPATYRASAYLRAVEKLGLEAVVALDPNAGIPEEAQNYLPVSFEQPECSATALAQYARSHSIAAVVSVDDGSAEVATLTARLLGLPHNSLESIRAANDKYVMRRLLEQAGVPSPRFRHHWMCEDPRWISHTVTYPVVLKPLYLSGSRGVIRANDPDEFLAAFERLARLLQQPGTGPEPKSFLIEEYIPGFEVSLEGILTDGKLSPLGLYDKPDPLEGPYFEETILITPSRLPADVQEQVVDCAARALEAVGLRVGPFQVELRVNEKGPWVVEFAARTMGGHCSRALPFEGALTLEELVVSHAAGLDTSRFVRADGAHGVMMIPIPGEGILQEVRGVELAEAVPGVTGVMITIPQGARVTPLPEGDKYMGFIFANGETPDAVERALREAHRHLMFVLEQTTRLRLRLFCGGG